MTTEYTYVEDQPDNTIAQNKRLGYRLPRSILLPPYLSSNDYFVAYADAIDTVFDQNVDRKTEIVGGLRNMWPTNVALETNYIDSSEMIPFEAWPQPEREILVRQVNMLGLKLTSAGLISNDSYQTISRWLGMYWFEKGTQSFIDFINYCLSTSLQVTKLWTEDYVNFVAEGDAEIGTPIWEGGTWYPTTHVDIVAQNGDLGSIDPATLTSFFYEIANYNLVLHAIEFSFNLPIVDELIPGYTNATVVALGLWTHNSIVISNVQRFTGGAGEPPVIDLV